MPNIVLAQCFKGCSEPPSEMSAAFLRQTTKTRPRHYRCANSHRISPYGPFASLQPFHRTRWQFGALAVIAMMDPARIDHKVVRGLADDDGEPGPSGFAVLFKILLALILLVLHFGNAPMSRLIAQQFAIELGTPFRTTAIITGIAQLAMVVVAVATPFLVRRLGSAWCWRSGLPHFRSAA